MVPAHAAAGPSSYATPCPRLRSIGRVGILGRGSYRSPSTKSEAGSAGPYPLPSGAPGHCRARRRASSRRWSGPLCAPRRPSFFSQMTGIPAAFRAASCSSVGPFQSPMYELIPAARIVGVDGLCSHTAMGKKSEAREGPWLHLAYGLAPSGRESAWAAASPPREQKRGRDCGESATHRVETRSTRAGRWSTSVRRPCREMLGARTWCRPGSKPKVARGTRTRPTPSRESPRPVG